MTLSRLLTELFKKYDYNPHSFSKKFGGSDVTYRDILTGETVKLSFKIKSKIEQAFDIIIDDSNPENIKFRKSNEPKKPDIKSTITEEEELIILRLRELGINSVEKVNYFFSVEGVLEDIKSVFKRRFMK